MAETSIPRNTSPNKIGDKFGKLTIIAPAKKRYKENKTAWLCSCECGSEKTILQNALRRGTTRSCGCLRHTATRIHGQWKSLTYRIWAAMKQRCLNPNDAAYKDYGGRGIKEG